MDQIQEIKEEAAKWQKKNNIESLPTVESELGHPIKILYTPTDVTGIGYLKEIGFPGEFPFVRGVYPLMYRGRPWGIRQYSGFGTAEDTNRRWKELISSGQTGGVSLANDLPTQLGYDSDDPLVVDEVGRVGCAIDTLKDLEILFDGIPLDKTPCTFNQSAQAPFFLAGLIAVAEKQHIDQSKLSGTMSNCMLLEYACRGNWIYPAGPSMRLGIDVAEYCIRKMPRYYPFNFFGCNLRSAGATMAQEIGYTFSMAFSYIEEALNRKLNVDEVAPNLTFFFSSGVKIFEEVAKLRAARKVWAKLMRDRYNARKNLSKMMRMTVYAFPSDFSPIEPELNLVRATCGVIAAALGGAQVIWSPAIDETFAIPNEKTARWALRTGQIISEETDVGRTVDPLGGSYFIETLTNEYELQITEAIKEIDRVGGAIKAIETGYIQRNLTNNAYQLRKKIEDGTKVIVGFNKYRLQDIKEEPIAMHRANPKSVELQIKRLKQIKAERDNFKVKAAFDRLKEVAEGKENIIPAFLEAVKAYATIGEITSVLKSVWGVFNEPVNVF
jgi:methylmalonyl-CoA mutase N-terminal domain/subunit